MHDRIQAVQLGCRVRDRHWIGEIRDEGRSVREQVDHRLDRFDSGAAHQHPPITRQRIRDCPSDAATGPGDQYDSSLRCCHVSILLGSPRAAHELTGAGPNTPVRASILALASRNKGIYPFGDRGFAFGSNFTL
ncbi:hypothetical protein SDC9_144820 [bioreactor metagenome]|uniref:Uncharacterized protein n=1 Tax=bioreactor metagenome TaxID=1076179 RepID=A0A645E837_9ZZZZ